MMNSGGGPKGSVSYEPLLAADNEKAMSHFSDAEEDMGEENRGQDPILNWRDLTWSIAGTEILAGLATSLALVPDTIAFSFVAGVTPTIGFTAAWLMCLIAGALGGRPGMISAATGSTCFVLQPFTNEYRFEHVFPLVILTGIVQCLLGYLGIGKLVDLFRDPITIGFCNGLALLMFMAQMTFFRDGYDAEGNEGPWIEGEKALITACEVLMTMFFVIIIPFCQTAVPSSLIAIVITTAIHHLIIVMAFNKETNFIEDFGKLEPSYPIPFFLDYPEGLEEFDSSMIVPYIHYSILLALVGLVESLLTLKVIDEITETKGDPTQECYGQGIANSLTAFFGGMGGCAMIGQSMVNLNGGARNRLSSYSAGFALFIFALALYPLINKVPVAALVGVMFVVVAETAEWSSLKLFAHAFLPESIRLKLFDEKLSVNKGDVFIMFLVTVMTPLTDLATAVIVGFLLSAVLYVIDTSNKFQHGVTWNDNKTVKSYEIRSPLYFGTAEKFKEIFRPKSDPDIININFHQSAEIVDFSALQAILQVSKLYEKMGKEISVRTTNVHSVEHIHKARDCLETTEVRYVEDLNVNTGRYMPSVAFRGTKKSLFQRAGAGTLTGQKSESNLMSSSVKSRIDFLASAPGNHISLMQPRKLRASKPDAGDIDILTLKTRKEK